MNSGPRQRWLSTKPAIEMSDPSPVMALISPLAPGVLDYSAFELGL